MPKSKNECEFIYDLPVLTDEEKQDMIDNPWEAQSDSFFFVNQQLIIHNKAAYNYQYWDWVTDNQQQRLFSTEI